MSGVKRYYAPGLDFMWRDQKDAPRECIPMVLASDYDKLACMVEVGHKLAMDAACGEIAALEAERDELRAQVEAMRVDAERYRWMRASFVRNHNHSLTWYLPMFEPLTAEGLDSNVDRARKAKP